MPTLNFPTNPTPNQQYSFGGKTWYWTGSAWRLLDTGAINNIPIGNSIPSTGTFTTLSSTGNISAANRISATGNISTAEFFVGNGRHLTGVVSSVGNRIDYGTTSLGIPSESGNIVFTVDGASNVLVITNTDLVSDINVVPSIANVYTLGTFDKPWAEGYFSNSSVWVGNAKLSANATSVIITNPEGGQFIFSGNVNYGPYANANVAAYLPTYTGNIAGGNVSVTGNVTAQNFIGNVTGNITVSAANTEVLYSDSGVASGDPNFTFDKATSLLSVAGNVNANTFVGNGVGLTNTLVDSGTDPNNWNTLTKMGVYTVNRVSWAGTTGTPLDSQVFVGLLEVKTSTNATTTQTFYPGTVDSNDVKIQWNRNYWSSSWTPWVQIVNDNQFISGGQF